METMFLYPIYLHCNKLAQVKVMFLEKKMTEMNDEHDLPSGAATIPQYVISNDIKCVITLQCLSSSPLVNSWNSSFTLNEKV